MTDVTTSLLPAGRPTAEETARRTRSRNAAETRFKAYGIAAIAIGLFFLVALLYAILTNGRGAFQQTFVKISIPLNAEQVAAAEASVVKTSKYRAMIEEALAAKVAERGYQTAFTDPGKIGDILSSGAPATLREHVLANEADIGKAVDFQFLASSRVDGYLKGRVTREALAQDKNLDAEHLDLGGIVGCHGFAPQTREAGLLGRGQEDYFSTGRPSRSTSIWRTADDIPGAKLAALWMRSQLSRNQRTVLSSPWSNGVSGW